MVEEDRTIHVGNLRGLCTGEVYIAQMEDTSQDREYSCLGVVTNIQC